MFERCLYFNSNALARRVNREWEAAYGELDLSPAHAYLLRLILAQPGLTQKQIGEALGLEKSTITRFVATLEKRGLLRRTQGGDDDGRVIQVMPTAKARRLQARLEQIGEQLYQRMRQILGREHMDSFVGELRETHRALDRE